MWVAKHKPKNLSDYVGQREATARFLQEMKKWKRGNALLLYGPPGVGKTALVEAYASEKKIDLIETNASDFRSSDQLRKEIGGAVTQRSLSGREKIFLLDEVDGISGHEDKGGIGEIKQIIRESVYPVILTANNPFDRKLWDLRQMCVLIDFKKLPYWDINRKLTSIATNEGVLIPPDILQLLAKNSNGDLRSAINDLEVLAKEKEITPSALAEIGSRERETSIFEALKIIFKTRSALAAKLALGTVDEDPEKIFWWIENNISNEYEKPREVASAFEALSKSDLFLQRIRRRQNWKLLAYTIDLMTGGVALSKKEMYRKFTRYQYPDRIALLGATKQERKGQLETNLQLAKKLHCSTRTVKTQFLPYLKIITNGKPEKLL